MSDSKIKSGEITDEKTFLNRRNFIRSGLLAGTTLATGTLYRFLKPNSKQLAETREISNIKKTSSQFSVENGQLTSFEEITNYNNFYEFSTDKSRVAEYAKNFITRPWTIEVGGLVQKPQIFGLEDILKIEQEERIYRFRCVEGWSMVIPWLGFPLKTLLDKVEPLAKAKYAAFQSYYSEQQMPNASYAGIEFPYVEGLRLDEALHPLTIMATGLYGKSMPNQNGAPIRLVVPWKYGFKSIKSVVKITLTEKEPPTTWNIAAPDEYGFYSNVNPAVSHPRWSQATEQPIGSFLRKDTLIFNGYGEEVGSLYQGMDLKTYFNE